MKTERYLKSLFDKHPGHKRANYSLLLFDAGMYGLWAWSLYFGGPALALSAAHALFWLFIVLAFTAIFFEFVAGFFRLLIKEHNPTLSDLMLFGDRTTNKIYKAYVTTRTFISPCLAILAGWPIASVCLGILCFTGIIRRALIKINQQSRLAELEQLSEATLMETLITQEDKDSMRQEIENLFKKSC